MTASQPERSARSNELLAVAREVTERAPFQWQDIAVTGSAARGCADVHSDLELCFWTADLPTASERERWLHSLGATSIQVDLEITGPGESRWSICRFRDVWVEVGWQQRSNAASVLEEVTAGRTVAINPMSW